MLEQDGEAAGQTVPHAHIHILPRRGLTDFSRRPDDLHAGLEVDDVTDSGVTHDPMIIVFSFSTAMDMVSYNIIGFGDRLNRRRWVTLCPSIPSNVRSCFMNDSTHFIGYL